MREKHPFSKLVSIILATLAGIGLSKSESKAGSLIQSNSYDSSDWNIDTPFYQDPLGSSQTSNPVSRVWLKADDISPITNLNFYAAGLVEYPLWEENPVTEKIDPVEGAMLRDDDGTDFKITGIENLGREPRIFGTNKYVFTRDFYKVKLATTSTNAHNNFNLKLDLITNEDNSTSTNGSLIFGVRYAPYGEDDYYGNRVWTIEEPDTDHDGLPDKYEQAYSGNPTNLNPNADDDGDGVINKDEYIAGTNPTNQTSVCRITNFERNPDNSFTVNWQGADENFWETPRTYTVSRSTNGVSEHYNSLESNLTSRTYTDTETSGNGHGFYRIEVDD